MALPSFVRATGITPASTNSATTLSAVPTIDGGFLFVASTHYTTGINVSAVVDTVGNTFTRAGTVQGGDANQDNEIWFTANPTVGTTSNSIIVRYTGNAGFRDVTQCQFSWGGVTSITYYAEAAHVFNSATTTATAVSGTLSVADEGLVIGNWVAYDSARTLSNSTGTIMVATPTTAAADMATAFRIFTGSTVAGTIQLVVDTFNYRYSTVAKSFRAVAAGTSTPSTALGITLPLTGAGQG